MIFGVETHKPCPLCQAWDEVKREFVCLWKENAFGEHRHESIIFVCHNCGHIVEKS